jgi:hypothetical protein
VIAQTDAHHAIVFIEMWTLFEEQLAGSVETGNIYEQRSGGRGQWAVCSGQLAVIGLMRLA